jgi:hypothetical protein
MFARSINSGVGDQRGRVIPASLIGVEPAATQLAAIDRYGLIANSSIS